MKFSFSLLALGKSTPNMDARFIRFVAPVSTPLRKSAFLAIDKSSTGTTNCQNV
jgi:hypothetical protein